MSDIVEELKLEAGEYGIANSDGMRDLCARAACEIIALRAQLASIRQVAGAVSLESGLTFAEIKSNASHAKNTNSD